ncbi:dihydrofolate reductase family protein [Fodinicola acaciae]|uniref:dihydrofolate reductase family protein n=1 Tax=Fodinicola acaciae TaxID=2681555 RepID=UPI0013D7E259|nr:dihydrofolate reductase family protein [Fodinicola acaciae]
MGKIVVTAFVTVDGVIQAPGFRDEDRDGGFDLGGWTQPYGDAVVERRVFKSVLAADALLLGRRAYELLSSFWPTADPDARTRKLNSQPKYVASRTLRTVEWNNTTLLRGDLVEQVAKLRAQYAQISVWGSSTLIQPLLENELLDEFVLLVYPIVVGSGKRLFAGGTPVGLELVEAETSTTGVSIHTYRRAEMPRLS